MKNIKKLGWHFYQETYHAVAGNMHCHFGTPYNSHKFISDSIIRALGTERLNSCSSRQLQLMDQMLDRRMRANKRVTDAELQGIYEMITEHVLPFSL